MKRAVLALLLAAASAHAQDEVEPGTHLAFVGEQLWVREMNPCKPGESLRPGETLSQAAMAANAERTAGGAPGTRAEQVAALKEMCVPFDHQFEATYRPVHNLAGTAPAPLVTFGVHDHYGTPGFFERRHALLVVTRAEDGAYLQKYMGFGAYRVAGGGWAVCGSQKSGANAPPQARPLTFLEPIRDLHGEDPAKLAEWRANSDLRIEGAQLFCRRGVPVGEYLDYLRDGVLKARGVTLAPVPTQ